MKRQTEIQATLEYLSFNSVVQNADILLSELLTELVLKNRAKLNITRVGKFSLRERWRFNYKLEITQLFQKQTLPSFCVQPSSYILLEGNRKLNYETSGFFSFYNFTVCIRQRQGRTEAIFVNVGQLTGQSRELRGDCLGSLGDI